MNKLWFHKLFCFLINLYYISCSFSYLLFYLVAKLLINILWHEIFNIFFFNNWLDTWSWNLFPRHLQFHWWDRNVHVLFTNRCITGWLSHKGCCNLLNVFIEKTGLFCGLLSRDALMTMTHKFANILEMFSENTIIHLY